MKEMVRMVNKQKDPEEKIYLVCLAFTSITDENTMWNIVVGRKAARDLIKDNIDFIDFDESFILVEGCTLEQRKSIYAFIKHIEQFPKSLENMKGDMTHILHLKQRSFLIVL